jgi:hypothetical protein
MPSKEYYLKNKEEILHKAKIYREKNKIKINKYFQSESYKNHKKEYDKKYRQQNKEKIKAKNKEMFLKNPKQFLEYWKTNREKINKQRQQYLLRNPEIRQKLLEKKRKEYRLNIDYYTKKNKLYKQKNKEIRNKKLSIRLKNDAQYRLKCNLKSRIRSALKGKGKSAKTMELIGCNIDQLKKHLSKKFKKGMNFENNGLKGWHIDHIKPCASFDLKCPVQQLACFNYNNLQPLWASENMSKGAKIL